MMSKIKIKHFLSDFLYFERLVHFKIPCLEKSCNSSSVNDLQAFQVSTDENFSGRKKYDRLHEL
jgi:hypothetical protein